MSELAIRLSGAPEFAHELLRCAGSPEMLIVSAWLFLALPLAVAVVVELVWRVALSKRGYDRKELATTLGVVLGHGLFEWLGRLVWLQVYLVVYRATPLRMPLDDWRTWLVGFVAVDMTFYFFHRASHTVSWFWANHRVHHTATQITLSAALRLPWTQLLSLGWLYYVPLVALGFHPLMVVGLYAANLAFQIFVHTELGGSFGPLGWVFNTPAHHRVHHATNEGYLGKNYGGVLIVFDRIFGTFAAEDPAMTANYGITGEPASSGPFDAALGEWRALLERARTASGTGETLRVLFGRPPALGLTSGHTVAASRKGDPQGLDDAPPP